MLLKVLKTSYTSQFVWLSILVAAMAFPAFYHSADRDIICIAPPTFLQHLIHFSPTQIYWAQILAALGLPLMACYYRHTLSRQGLLHIYNLAPCFLFVILLGYTHPSDNFFWHLIYIGLILSSLSHIFKSAESPKASEHILSAAMLLSLSSFVSYASFFLFPTLWIAFIILQQYNYKYFVISILGFILPYFFMGTYLYLDNQLGILTNWHQHLFFHLFYIPTYFSSYQIISTLLLLSMGGIALWHIVPIIPKQLIMTRRKIKISFAVLLLSVYPFIFIDDILSKDILPIFLIAFLSYFIQMNKASKIFDWLATSLITLVMAYKYYLYYAPQHLF